MGAKYVSGDIYKALTIIILIIFNSCYVKPPEQDAQVRKVSEVDKTAAKALSVYNNKTLAQKGYIDVTAFPYGADATGNTDATAAIQQALNDARDARMICYLPAGRYLVSNTISGIQGTVEWDNWHFEGFADPWLKYASFEYPNVIMGSSEQGRTVIILADSAQGFDDLKNPKPVVHFWSRMEYGEIDKSKPQPNINFNQKIINIDFELGKNNTGAVAINHQGAEGSTIEDVNIDAEGSFAGIQNAPGSGGGIYGVSVIGGKFGLYFRNNSKSMGSQPSPVVASVKLTDQTDNSILYDGRGPLTLVGAFIDGAGILAECSTSDKWNGTLNLVDVIIKTKNGSTSIRSNRSVVLDNVFIENADSAVVIDGQNILQGKRNGWLHVRQFAASGANSKTNGNSDPADIWENGMKTSNPVIVLGEDDPVNPDEFISRHIWPHPFPSGLTKGAVNVMDAPYLAKGDGISDDSESIQNAIDENETVFIPKGVFAVSKPLVLKSNTILIGLGNIQTVITATTVSEAFSDPDNPQPLIKTVDDPDAKTILAFMKILVPVRNPCVYALCWRAGQNSVVRNVYPIREVSHPHATSMGFPMVRIEKSGGGQWFTNVLLHWWDQGPTYRHLLIENTMEPLRFYMLEPQHGRGDCMVEIKNSKNIDVFAMKSEGDYGVVSIDSCSNIRIFGYAGNGMPSPGYSLFTIRNSEEYLLANINPQQKKLGHFGALGTAHKPENWFILSDLNKGKEIRMNGNGQIGAFFNLKPKGR